MASGKWPDEGPVCHCRKGRAVTGVTGVMPARSDALRRVFATEGTMATGPVSRILSRLAAVTAIPLGRTSLRASSDLPGTYASSPRRPSSIVGVARRAGTPPDHSGIVPYLVLLRVGFALPRPLLGGRCALTAPFHPYPGKPGRYVFCGTFRKLGLTPASRTLSGTLLCGVRTFLYRPPLPERGSGRPARLPTLLL